MRQLSLEFLTVPEVDTPRHIELAAEYGCAFVGLLIQPMRPFPFFNLLGDTPQRRMVRRRCVDLGITVDVVDAFNLQPETDPESFRLAIESSAYLGANWINVLARDPDQSRLLDSFGGTCEIAREYGIKVSTEISRRFAHDTLPNTVAFLEKLGDPDARITVDSMHFFRNDGTIAQMKQHMDWIARVQICDGADGVPVDKQLEEARTRRLPPGDGVFPLQEFLDALPDDRVIGVELPNTAMSLEERVGRSVRQTRGMADRRAAT